MQVSQQEAAAWKCPLLPATSGIWHPFQLGTLGDRLSLPSTWATPGQVRGWASRKPKDTCRWQKSWGSLCPLFMLLSWEVGWRQGPPHGQCKAQCECISHTGFLPGLGKDLGLHTPPPVSEKKPCPLDVQTLPAGLCSAFWHSFSNVNKFPGAC